MAEEFPFDISPMYEGERIRGKDFYVELGGPKKPGFELVRVAPMDEVEDGKFTLIGPDVPDIPEGSSIAFAQIYKVAGEKLEEALEGVLERRVHDFQNYIQGFMHLNQRYDIWLRLSKEDVKKGVTFKTITGEYTGVSDMVKEKSGGAYDRMTLHSFFDAPHTSCGCFEVIGFYIPEVDGIGWVDRDFPGKAPNGLTFANMAGQAGGGKQIVGFLGVGIGYFGSEKFIQADGGLYRTVWLASTLRKRIEENIPEDLKDKIADESIPDIDSLKKFLLKVNHPVVTGVIRKVDNKQITEGWTLKKITGKIKNDVLKYIEESGGDIDLDDVADKLALSEKQFMQVVDKLVEEGYIEM